MWRLILLLLTVVAACSPNLQIGEFPMKIAANIILAVQRKLSAGCLFLLHSPHSEIVDFVAMSHLQKMLASQFFSTAVVFELLFQAYSKNIIHCQRNHPLHIILSSSQDTKNLLLQMVINKSMSKAKWLMFVDSTVTLEDFFNDIHIPLNCEFMVVQKNGSSGVTFNEVYKAGPGLQLSVAAVGVWNWGGPVAWSKDSILSKRANLQNLKIRVAVEPDNMSIIIKKSNSAGQPLKVGGIFGEVWNSLQEELNFRTEFVQPADHAWGSLQEDNTWNGMVGMVVREEADVAITAFTMTKTRLRGVNFMPPYWSDGLTLYIQKPNEFRATKNQYLTPFSKSLWNAIGISFLILAACLSATYYLGRRCAGIKEAECIQYTVTSSILLALNILCQQGQEVSPTSFSCRIVFMTAYTTAVIVLISYSATFISILAVQNPKLPFTTFQGMLEDGTYHLGVLQSSAELDIFEKANDSLLQLLNRKLIAPQKRDLPKSHLEGLLRVCSQENYAFLGPKSILQSLMSDIPCRIIPVPHAYIPATSAMVISKHSAYSDLLKHNIQKLHGSGILQRLLKMMSPEEPRLEDLSGELKSVDLQAVNPVIIACAVGTATALIIFLIEVLRNKYRNTRRKTKDLVRSAKNSQLRHTYFNFIS